MIAIGYGTQRREAITGAVSTVDPSTANVGVITNANQLIQGRVAGVEMVTNNGEPGSGAQIRIRGSTSISANNEPLYVIDGVPVANDATSGSGFDVAGGSPPLARSALNLLNPADIGSITILKDASATAIYGSRGANGVILIETKKGSAGGASVEYDTYAATSTPARRYDVLTGPEYRAFVQSQVAIHNADSTRGLDSSAIATLGAANTDWARVTTRTATTQNHNLRFAGGSDVTRYLASLNYMNQDGVALANGMKRLQGRLSATHQALNSRLRLGLNVTTSQVNDQFLTYENNGGFAGGFFENVATFNPTQPVTVTDSLGTRYFETGSTSVRNPVALAEQITDRAATNRTLGNLSADFDILPNLTARINVGADKSTGLRQLYIPKSNPIGSAVGGLARQGEYTNVSRTLQTQLSYRRQVGAHSFDVIGAYEWTQIDRDSLIAESHNFLTDAFSFNNMGSGTVIVPPTSGGRMDRWISFLTRANYGYKERYFVTGVLRYDGRSSFAKGHQWTAFPGISASWRLSQENFLAKSPFSDLRLRVGYGVVGNPGAAAYSSLLTLDPSGDARYVFGTTPITGIAPNRNANPNLSFERTSQLDIGVDYGLMQNRISGSLEYYVKNTSDLLLTVNVPQPAPVVNRLENVGKIRNRGVELSLDALPISRPALTWRAGIVLSVERNKVVDLGPYTFITTGTVSGQGQSGQTSQRVIPGFPIGTFYGPVYAGVDSTGRQLFRCSSLGAGDTTTTGVQKCLNGVMRTARASDYKVIGNANPDFTLGFHSEVSWRKFDFTMLVRGSFGQDVFNNTALVYATKGNALQGKNFLRGALTDPIRVRDPAVYSSRWIEKASFLRLQNITVGYSFDIPSSVGAARTARVYVSGDNLLLLTGYSGLDPEVFNDTNIGGIITRGVDYLSYPRARTVTAGVRVAF